LAAALPRSLDSRLRSINLPLQRQHIGDDIVQSIGREHDHPLELIRDYFS
jgi:hypothetical protein